MSILPPPLPEGGGGRITRVYLAPFMVSYKMFLFSYLIINIFL